MFVSQVDRLRHLSYITRFIILLEVLRIGNNKIISKESIIYLRKLSSLKTLSLKGIARKIISILVYHHWFTYIQHQKTPRANWPINAGNPVTQMDELDGFVAAFLPSLVYFEFKMVDQSLRKKYLEKNQGEIFKVIFYLCMYIDEVASLKPTYSLSLPLPSLQAVWSCFGIIHSNLYMFLFLCLHNTNK